MGGDERPKGLLHEGQASFRSSAKERTSAVKVTVTHFLHFPVAFRFSQKPDERQEALPFSESGGNG